MDEKTERSLGVTITVCVIFGFAIYGLVTFIASFFGWCS